MLQTSARIFMQSNMRVLVQQSRSVGYYSSVFRDSLNCKEEFWAEKAELLTWHKKWDRVYDKENLKYPKWFDGGQLNITYNALDRHVADGYGEQIAVIHDSPVTRSIHRLTYSELLDKVSRLSRVLVNHGVQKGDRVVIYMPMITETLITMLACARVGAIHALVFGGFSATELSKRIKLVEPKVIVSANVGLEPGVIIDYKKILDDAITLSGVTPNKCIIFNRNGFAHAKLDPARDLDFSEEIDNADTHDAVPVEANDPLYILHTSGTTDLPKGVVRPSAGYAVALNWSMGALYDTAPGEVWWSASDFGWVVGHSYICYAPLLNRNTTIIYEGKPVGTPDAGQFFRVLAQHNVVSMFCAPTAMRAIRREDPDVMLGRQYHRPFFRSLFLAGEHCDPVTMEWTQKVFRSPVIDHWWQTETGWPITSTCLGLGDKAQPPSGVAGKPVPGFDVRVMPRSGPVDAGSELPRGELGRILIQLPLPPGNLITLWQNDKKYEDTYFARYPGFYDTMDAGFVGDDGNVVVISRDDDVINVAGHRLSAGALEEAIMENPDLAECAVIGLADELKGHVPLGLLVLHQGISKSDEKIIEETCRIVRQKVGPVASFKQAVVVGKLPKTRSGKISRNTLALMAAGKPFKMPVTIDDPTVYAAIKESFQAIGLHPSDPSA